MKKMCIKCKQEKEDEEFPLQSYINKNGERGRRTECKKCLNKKRDERRKKNGITESRKESQLKKSVSYHRNNPISGRERHLKYTYGITLDDYNKMFLEQNGCCKICSKYIEETTKKVLDVDHCHTTGKVRGLLCTDCNNLLGRAKDNIDILYAAVAYLESHK